MKPQVRFPSLPGVEPHRQARGRLSNGARFGRKERKSRSEIEIVFTSDDSGDERDRRKTREEGRRVGDFFALASGLPRRWVAKQTGTPGQRAARCRRLCPLSQSVSQCKRERSAISLPLATRCPPLSSRTRTLSRGRFFLAISSKSHDDFATAAAAAFVGAVVGIKGKQIGEFFPLSPPLLSSPLFSSPRSAD